MLLRGDVTVVKRSSFGIWLDSMLEDRHMSRNELAEMLDITYSAIHSWVKAKPESKKTDADRQWEEKTGGVIGETMPSQPRRVLLARALGVTVDTINEALYQVTPRAKTGIVIERRREISAKLPLLDDAGLVLVDSLVDNLIAQKEAHLQSQVPGYPDHES